MSLTNPALIREAIGINHAGVCRKTLQKYQGHLTHFDAYLTSVHNATFYTAKTKHIILFLKHLEGDDGSHIDDLGRLTCAWCRVHGYPAGRNGTGLSPSTQKSHLSAIRFLYKHFNREEDLPDIDPSRYVPCPKVYVKTGYTPTWEEVQPFLSVSGTPADTLLAHWLFYAPSRRATFANARWRDIDLDAGTWEVLGKGQKVQIFTLHPLLITKLRAYKSWIFAQAQGNPKIDAALHDETAEYVLLTRNGRKMQAGVITRMVKWRAVRAGVGVRPATANWDCPRGLTSTMSPHALRRAWATIALNDRGEGLDVIQEVLGHADISTTRIHYAKTLPARAQAALVDMPFPSNTTSSNPVRPRHL